MLKEKIKETEHSLSERQCKWRNYYFSKDGRLHLGKGFWSTLSEAELAAKRLIMEGRNKGGREVRFTGIEPPLMLSQYAWHMQIPVLQP